jgi:phosphoglycolate phosphatase
MNSQIKAGGDLLQDVIQNAHALIFDFDGTLVDSNKIKWEAFRICFSAFPGHLEKILEYCTQYNHVPRDEKFETVYRDILGLDYTARVREGLHEMFDQATTQRIIEAAEIPGASQFLAWAAAHHETALLSSTPDEYLTRIIEQRGWQNYFKTLKGAPVDKAAWIQMYCREQALRGQDVVFFGDTDEDAEAARLAGCCFFSVKRPVRSGREYSIPNFMELI